MITEDLRKKLSVAQIGKKHSNETKNKIRNFMLGKKFSLETRIKMSNSISIATKGKPRLGQRGNKHYRWNGGSSENQRIRGSMEYKIWRTSVFQRDNYTCIWGGKAHSSKLNADHIKSFALYPELRFAIDNGRTLCEACHATTDTYKGKSKIKI